MGKLIRAERLDGVHEDLVRVIKAAVPKLPFDILVVQGRRNKQEQAKYVATGRSGTMNSRHLTGHAVDISPLIEGALVQDWPLYYQIAPVVKEVAKKLDVDIEWGGDWKRPKDGPHWQLSWKKYPVITVAAFSGEETVHSTPDDAVVASGRTKIEESKVNTSTVTVATSTLAAGAEALRSTSDIKTYIGGLAEWLPWIFAGVAICGSIWLLYLYCKPCRRMFGKE